MTAVWFKLDDFYDHTTDKCVFYPSHYARGYRFSAEDQARMNDVLGPFLERRLWVEFIAVFCFVTFALLIAASGFLVTASTEELDAILAAPPWLWLVIALALAVLILIPVLFRLRSKIGRQLEEMGVDASEPARPDFFVVEGAFSLRRLSYALLAVGAIMALFAAAL